MSKKKKRKPEYYSRKNRVKTQNTFRTYLNDSNKVKNDKMKTNERGDLFLTFDFGMNSPSIAQQAEDQGVEFKARMDGVYDELAWAISILWAYQLITPTQVRDARIKLNDLIIGDLYRKVPDRLERRIRKRIRPKFQKEDKK